MEELSRNEKVVLHVLKIIEDLIDKGIIEGPKRLTDKAREHLAEMEKQGFRPTEKEISWAMNELGYRMG